MAPYPRPRRRLGPAIWVLAALAATGAAAQQAPTPSPTDYLKQAGNFLENCDARRDETGERPEPNYICLAFLAGLVEGYTYAAVANGNPRPYCLQRPTSLVELSDMMTTVIARGVPETMPTAAVFHFILTVNFACAPQADDGDAGAPQEAPWADDAAGNGPPPPDGSDDPGGAPAAD